MIFGYFTLFVALVISAVAEFYSIVGLMAIFAAAPIPVAIMGAALGIGKITAAVWLKLNWPRASLTYKLYLIPAVALLMSLTSMGIFGFLSKAHSDQSLVSGDVISKIAIFDEKIKTSKENIDANRKALKQMDEAVDQVMGRSTDEKGADKAVALRRGQQKERGRLLAEIETEQKKIAQITEERAPIAAEVRKVEAEVGPIKYIAALIYGDNPDTNLLERAVRWVIILIVLVFDPLALILILAGQQTIRWGRESKEQQTPVYTYDDFDKPTKEELDEIGPAPDFNEKEEHRSDEIEKHTEPVVEDNTVEELSTLIKHPYLNKPFDHFENLTPMVYKPEETVAGEEVDPVTAVVEEPTILAADIVPPSDQLTSTVSSKFPKIPETAQRIKVEQAHVPEALNIRKLQADNVEAAAVKSGFGLSFPAAADKGDMFLRVDQLPNRLYKYNGTKWIEVDKERTDSYTYDEKYINYLIEKLKSGEYEIDQLSSTEQDLVAQTLQSKNDQT